MSAYREVRLFCNHHDEPGEGQRSGRHCGKEFQSDPELGFISSVVTMRREARKAGWTYVRHPRVRSLDRDYCPDHKPED